ncbi:hypothetical protein EMIT0210MI2_10775 [Priestia megaterium]
MKQGTHPFIYYVTHMCEVTLNGRTIFFKYMNTCIKIEELLETKYKLLQKMSHS